MRGSASWRRSRELGVHLLEHLDYEELQAGPSIRRLDRLHGR